jgi:hypothetical protein
MSASANSKTIAISNTETILANGGLAVASGSLSNGDCFKVTLVGTLGQNPPSQLLLNIRIGANGNVGDAAIYSSNNQISSAQLLDDLNFWGTQFPGVNGNEYAYPARANNAVVPTPAYVSGELFVVVNSVAANVANVSVVSSNPVANLGASNWIQTLPMGVVSSANVASNVNNFITVSHSMIGQQSYVFKPGSGNAGPSKQFVLQQGANGTSQFFVSIVQKL